MARRTPDPTPTPRTQPSRDRAVEPRLPHERDESADSQAPSPATSPSLGKRAHDDVAQGRQDTDRGPVLDELYNDRVAPDDERGSR